MNIRLNRIMGGLGAVCLLATFAGASLFADAKGEQIAKQHFDLAKPADSSETATMIVTDASGVKKTRTLEIFTKNKGADHYSFVNFLDPADVRGTRFLTNKVGGTSDQRIYLPALKKSRKIAAGEKGTEFVNSDLFYYDMEDRAYSDFTYTFLAENETLADKAFAGMKFYKIEMKPVDPTVPYGRNIAWINDKDFQVYQLQSFDKAGALWKTFSFLKMETIGGILMPTQTLVRNHKKSSATALILSNVKINTGLKDEVFSLQNLEK